MEIFHPTSTTYWIASAGEALASGVTTPEQVTTFGPTWIAVLQTGDESEWLEECARLGIAAPEPSGP
jgi:hypothetical protein